MRKTAFALLIFGSAATVLLFACRNLLLHQLLQRAVDQAPALAARRGVQLLELDYAEASVDRFLGATLRDGQARLRRKLEGDPVELSVQAKSVTWVLQSYWPPLVTLEVSGVNITLERESASSRYLFDRIAVDSISYHDGVPALQPIQAVKHWARALDDVVTGDGTRTHLEFSGRADLRIAEKPVAFRVATVRKNEWSKLALNLADLRQAVASLELEASEQELQLMSEFPTRMPKILRFAKAGSRNGRRFAREHSVATRDSYRHLFWSYHLTREFGPEFAQRVTDAHEQLPGNTRAERRMDYHNNALGREWGKQRLAPAQLERMILTDPRPIHRPRDLPVGE